MIRLDRWACGLVAQQLAAALEQTHAGGEGDVVVELGLRRWRGGSGGSVLWDSSRRGRCIWGARGLLRC